MAIEHAEKCIQAARLAFEGTAYDEAQLLCRHATRLCRQSMVGRAATPQFMRRVDAITAESARIQTDLQIAIKAGMWGGSQLRVVQ